MLKIIKLQDGLEVEVEINDNEAHEIASGSVNLPLFSGVLN